MARDKMARDKKAKDKKAKDKKKLQKVYLVFIGSLLFGSVFEIENWVGILLFSSAEITSVFFTNWLATQEDLTEKKKLFRRDLFKTGVAISLFFDGIILPHEILHTFNELVVRKWPWYFNLIFRGWEALCLLLNPLSLMWLIPIMVVITGFYRCLVNNWANQQDNTSSSNLLHCEWFIPTLIIMLFFVWALEYKSLISNFWVVVFVFGILIFGITRCYHWIITNLVYDDDNKFSRFLVRYELFIIPTLILVIMFFLMIFLSVSAGLGEDISVYGEAIFVFSENILFFSLPLLCLFSIMLTTIGINWSLVTNWSNTNAENPSRFLVRYELYIIPTLILIVLCWPILAIILYARFFQ